MANVLVDPNASPENWKLTFGEPTILATSNNLYFVLNRIFLFKGMVDLRLLGGGYTKSTENNNAKCTRELVGGEHMICLDCLDEVHAILPDKIACVPLSFGLTTGPPKGGNLHPNLRIFCPEGYAYLPLVPGGSCVPCTNGDCSRCLSEDQSKCLGCKTQTFLRKGPDDSCVSSPCATNEYLTSAEGNICIAFGLAGCNKMDQYGWCSKVDGEGCASG